MTVMTRYFNYQSAGKTHPLFGKGIQPALSILKNFVMQRWGGSNLGTYGVRTIVGGTSWSTHSFGTAWDWRYENPGMGRAAMLAQVMPFLIDNSGELGIQYVGDYVGSRIWISDRTGTDWDQRWKPQPRGSQMGQSWAQWLHIEIHPDWAADGRPIDEKLGFPPDAPGTIPPFNPEFGEFGLWPIIPYSIDGSTPKKLTKVGATGDCVRYIQGSLRFKLGYGLPVDGQFGPTTEANVRWFQSTRGLTADGIAGRQTLAAIDALHR